MKDIAVISIQDGILLGLRFKHDGALRIAGIIGGESLVEPGVYVVQGFAAADVLTELPSPTHLGEAEISRERSIHMLQDDRWSSAQTGRFLLHQIRPNLRCNMVSPLMALAALQRNVGDGISYLSKQREIFLNQGSIELSTAATAESRSGYLCGPNALHTQQAIGRMRVIRFEDMQIELEHPLRSELQGLGHLFALTVGTAHHLVNTAAPYTSNNS